MSKLDDIFAERTARRRRMAEAAVTRVFEDLHPQGIDIVVFGSLARGDFRMHSDVDFLVRGPIDPDIRLAVERGVAAAMREADLPYDIIYVDDLTPAQAAAFERA